VTATGYRRLSQLPRYLQAMERRLDKLPENPARDAANMAVAQRVEQAYRQAAADLTSAGRAQGVQGGQGGQGVGAGLAETRWMLEELRVSLFAQTLGTQAPVSENRVLAALERLSG
jgi:ATP-dependent helicase HrpA